MEQLKQIGEHLCKERQARSIPLEEVALKTYIPLRLLQALELGQVERLPEPVFVQGFIRRYADILGLDGTVLASTFITESPVPAPAIAESEASPWFGIAPVQVTIQQVVNRLSQLPRPGFFWLPVISLPVVLGGVAVVLLGSGVMFLLNRPRQASDPQPVRNSVEASSTSQATNPALQAMPTLSPSPTVEAPVKVVVSITEDAWMEVTVDGKSEFADTLKKGEQRIWTAQNQILVRSGNAGGVLISYNDGAAKRLGRSGDVENASFPPKENETGQTN
jgi:cytoskeletal protein RodZ